jgi:hypothetical protein
MVNAWLPPRRELSCLARAFDCRLRLDASGHRGRAITATYREREASGKATPRGPPAEADAPVKE